MTAGIFPEAEKDPVIQIASMVVRQGQRDPFVRNVFTLGTCAPIVGSHVLACRTEEELLLVGICIYLLYTCPICLACTSAPSACL